MLCFRIRYDRVRAAGLRLGDRGERIRLREQ